MRVLRPMPRASVSKEATVKLRCLSNERNAYRRSLKVLSMLYVLEIDWKSSTFFGGDDADLRSLTSADFVEARITRLPRLLNSFNVFVSPICCLIMSSELTLVHSADVGMVDRLVWPNCWF